MTWPRAAPPSAAGRFVEPPHRMAACASPFRLRPGTLARSASVYLADAGPAGRRRIRALCVRRHCGGRCRGVASLAPSVEQAQGSHGECGRGRLPVGRRGQGQDRRLALRAGRHRRALPGRPQCRPYARHRRRHLQAVAAAVGRGAARQAVGDRQRRRARSAARWSRRSTGSAAQGVDGHAATTCASPRTRR